MSAYLESNLDVAAFLMARGLVFAGMELVGSRYAFTFNDPDNVASDLAWEYSRGSQVPAREFAAAQQRLKTALYGAKSQQTQNRRDNHVKPNHFNTIPR